MPQANEGRKTFIAKVAMARAIRVKLGATEGEVEIAGAGELGIGATAETVAIGAPVSIRLDNHTTEMTADSAIAFGAQVEQAADGKIKTLAVADRIGIAFEAAAADLDKIEVMPIGVDS